jgi:hypothetical protein
MKRDRVMRALVAFRAVTAMLIEVVLVSNVIPQLAVGSTSRPGSV